MEYRETGEKPVVGYEFEREDEATSSARELDRRFTGGELLGLRVYRVRWNGNYLVEATFRRDIEESRVRDARAILGESGSPVHPEDLEDYKKASDGRPESVPDWLRKFFGRRY